MKIITCILGLDDYSSMRDSIKPLTSIARKYKGQIKVILEGGIRSGPDVARTLASGASLYLAV